MDTSSTPQRRRKRRISKCGGYNYTTGRRFMAVYPLRTVVVVDAYGSVALMSQGK